MLRSLIGLLILLWVLGLVFRIGGGLIHILLVIAGIIFVIQLVTGNSRNP